MGCLIKFADSQSYAPAGTVFNLWKSEREFVFTYFVQDPEPLLHIDVWSFFLSQAFLNSLREEGGITFDQLRK